MLHVEQLTLLYVHLLNGLGEETTNPEVENKVHYWSTVKVGELGIFRWLDVYYLDMASLF